MKLLDNGKFVFLLLILAIVMSACRGQPSQNTQVQPVQNMYWQQKYKAFEKNEFFEDNRAMLLPVEGTIARGHLRNDDAVFAGLDDNGDFVRRIPLKVDRAFVKRGQDQYNIFCTPCHGGAGYGDGIVIGRGYVPPPSFHDERIVNMPDGEIYSAIYNGINSMPSYRNAVKTAEDRWAIVAYIRALQVSQSANPDQVEYLGLSATEQEMPGMDMASN